MDDIWEQYQLRRSEWVANVLSETEAQDAVQGYHKFITVAFYSRFKASLPVEIQNIADLNETILTSALESAYIDLRSLEMIHDHDRGPSASKVGAALACWINCLKPIQFKDPGVPSSPENDPAGDIALVNSVFAVIVGWGFILHDGPQRTSTDGPANSSEQVLEMMREDARTNDLIYHLAWRSPNFRSLIPIFQYLPG